MYKYLNWIERRKNAQIALDKAKEVGHIDEVFEKLASNLELVIKETDEIQAV